MKPTFDVLIALAGLLKFSQIFIIMIIGRAIVNAGKPLFFQKRLRKNEEIFRNIKFKSLNDKKDAHGNPLRDAEQLTPIGVFFRKTSLDEIPQLKNV